MDRVTFGYISACFRANPHRFPDADVKHALEEAVRWMTPIPFTQSLVLIVEQLSTRFSDRGGGRRRGSQVNVDTDHLTALAELISLANGDIERIDIAFAFAGALVAEFSHFIDPLDTNDRNYIPLIREMASYQSWLGITAALEDFTSQEGGLRNEFAIRTREIINNAAETVNTFSKEAAAAKVSLEEFQTERRAIQVELTKHAVNYRKSTEGMEASVSLAKDKINDIDKRGAEVETSAKAAIESMLVKAGAASGRDFWIARSRSSRRMLTFTGAGLGLLMIVVPIIAFANIDALITAIARINTELINGMQEPLTGTQLTIVALNRLLVFALPVAIYLWMIRILVRLTLHSVAAAEDAEQRHTVIDSFVHLLGTDVAKPEDRGKMFDAVFRPPVSLTGEANDPPAIMNTIIDNLKPGK